MLMKQSSLQQLTPQSQGGNKQQGGRNHCETRAWRCIGEQNTRPSPGQAGENKVGQTEGREGLEDACLPETTLSILRKWDSAEFSETQHTRAHTHRRTHVCTQRHVATHTRKAPVRGAPWGCWEEGGVSSPSRPGFTLRRDHTSPAGRQVRFSDWSI